MQAAALKALLDTATNPERPASGSLRGAAGGGGAPDGGDGGSPVKIALFSLGNMCAHKECREALLQVCTSGVCVGGWMGGSRSAGRRCCMCVCMWCVCVCECVRVCACGVCVSVCECVCV